MNRKEQIDGNLRDAQDLVARWRGLLESPQWKFYEAMIEEQVRLRQATVCLTPLSSFGKSLEQEFMKGEAAGLGTALAMPQTQLEMAKLDVERLTVELDKEIAYETTRKPDGGSRIINDDFSGQ